MKMMRALATLTSLSLAVLATASCELEIALGHLPATSSEVTEREQPAALDILVVVDNSGSMAEEQAVLAQALFREGCPIQGLTSVPEALQNPSGELLAQLKEICGIAQILAAYDRDFRLGVITTDVNACDNLIPEAQGGNEHGFRPQRGCLQPVPSTGQKIISRSDVDVAAKFVDLMSEIGTYGSPFERGLDAVDALFDGDTVHPECEGDGALFRREGAGLLILFATDEDDCSHGDGASGFDDETSSICGNDPSVVTEHDPDACYTRADELAPVDAYAARWQALAGDAGLRVLVVGGAVPLDDGSYGASGCIADQGAVDTACFESGGLSNTTDQLGLCAPETEAARGGLPCCTADAATRYQELASLVDGSMHSICTADFVGAVVTALQ